MPAALLVVLAALVYVVLGGGAADGPASLRLVALTAQGTFADTLDVPAGWASATPPADAAARFPLVLAVRNEGRRAANLTSLELSVPARFRLTDGAGRPLVATRSVGNPLVRYVLPVQQAIAEPGAVPTVLGGLDTLWVEALAPAWYCVAAADSVPEIVPAPPLPPALLAETSVFFSFAGPDLERRQTGLLTVRLDPAAIRPRAAPSPPQFEAQVSEPEADLPELSMLVEVGSTRAQCGAPEDPLELLSTVWETPGGGRFIVLSYGGAPRKYLYDLDRDSIVELEAWDPDGDLLFEAKRVAQFPIPDFLLPPAEVELVLPWADTLRADTMPRERPWPAWIRLEPSADTAAVDTVGADTIGGVTRPGPAAGRAPEAAQSRAPATTSQPTPAPPRDKAAVPPRDTSVPRPTPQPVEPRPPVLGDPVQPRDTTAAG